jgi:hypothetical protein
MGGIGLEGKLGEGLHNGSRGEEFVKVAWLVRFKPNRHDPLAGSKVFELCETEASLGGNPLRAVTAQFHEDPGAAALATDAVALSVERFEASAGGAFVVNEFNHFTLSKVGDRSSRFEPVPPHEPFIRASKVSGAMMTKSPREAR